MRLGSCIALEVATGVLTLSAAAWGVAFAAGAVRGEKSASAQVAAVAPAAVRPVVEAPAAVTPAPSDASGSGSGSSSGVAAVAAAVAVDPDEIQMDPDEDVDGGAAAAAGALAPVWRFLDQDDEALLAPLRQGTIARVKFNGGGSSLSMRLEFTDGSKAAFKPDQIHRQSMPRKEVAAYRIDRLLGIGRVPPAIARAFSYGEIEAKIASTHREYAHRLPEEAVPRGGKLRGELSWWIPVLGTGFVDGKYKIDSDPGMDRWTAWLHVDGEIPPADAVLVPQVSTQVAFDFLIDNLDRWSGGNAVTTEDGKTLYSMDNQMAFSLEREGHPKSQKTLRRVEKFSRGLITRLRALDEATLAAVLAPDTGPYEQLLTGAEIKALLARKDALLAYVDGLIARHGEAKVLAFP